MSSAEDVARTVLLVDDDVAVRQIAAVILAEMGFRVIEAPSAEAALEALRAPARIDLMLTDLAMPGMGGMELAHLAKRLQPDLPIIYTSAYLRSAERGSALRYGPLIEKPWVLEQLRAVIEKVLPSNSSTASGVSTLRPRQ